MNLGFQIPSWKTGIKKRLRKYTRDQIIEFIGASVLLGMMILSFTVMIVVEIYTPPVTW